MMRLLVTGRNGQVATALLERAKVHGGIEVTALGRPELDLEKPETVGPAILAARPDIVVNAAAYTAVDKAESEADRAFAANRDGAGAAAAAAHALGVPFIHLSTDYVYPGDKPAPYVESDATGPLGVYGKSKLAGEEAVRAAHSGAIILRTSWVYSPFGANFVKTMLRIGKERETVRVVDDQFGNPTSAIDIADAILRIAPGLVSAPGSGAVLHCCGEGSTTWCGFARHIFAASARLGGPAPRVEAITTAEFPTPARRPGNSRMETAAFAARFGFSLRRWQDAADETVARLLAGS
jgi:dTDP-4-dehydrorhamnose reductase